VGTEDTEGERIGAVGKERRKSKQRQFARSIGKRPRTRTIGEGKTSSSRILDLTRMRTASRDTRFFHLTIPDFSRRDSVFVFSFVRPGPYRRRRSDQCRPQSCFRRRREKALLRRLLQADLNVLAGYLRQRMPGWHQHLPSSRLGCR
jgi:hypothetical protein